ncbi:MAG: TonB-dependent siderophore receptor [Bacteroidetes bacterium SW_9_63_38]|nr:MAG: TonB-dependent siderophore receptor [Bacteroidetes bacterium SW_9_63_38]
MQSPIARTVVVIATVLSITILPAHAQQGTITGTVTTGADAEKPLSSVNVGIVDTPYGAASGENGRFRISDVPVGTYTVKTSLVGYSNVEHEVQVRTGETTPLKIRLSQKSVELSGITVTGRQGGYVPEEVTSATKIGAPLSETPQSVSVVTRDRLAALSIDRVSEALRYTSGTQGETFGFEPRTFFFRFRGFDNTSNGLYRDGLQLRTATNRLGYDPEPYASERIEVPKGPASVLYGAGSPGGLVDFVSKTPTQEPFGEVIAEAASHNHFQGKADVSGPIDDDGTFSYRLIGVAREANTQVNNVPYNRLFVAPSLSWRPSDATALTLLGRYQQDETRSSQRLPVQGTLDSNPNGDLPVDRFLGEPDFGEYDRQQWSIGSLFSHELNDAWSITQKTRYYSIDIDDKSVFGDRRNGLDSRERLLQRSAFKNFPHLDGVATDNQVRYEGETGVVNHTVLAGLDVQWLRLTRNERFGGKRAGVPTIDVFAPTSGNDIPPSLRPTRDSKTTQRQLGVYLQDQFRFQNWIATLNGRVDWATTDQDTLTSLPGQGEFEVDDREFSGRVGLVYDSEIGLNPYASYSQSFLPVIGQDPDGNPFEPETGGQWEAGLKYQPPQVNGSIRVSLYDLTRENLTQFDPSVDARGAQVQTGEANPQGIEVEGLASLDFGLDVRTSLTLQDVEITESAVPAEEGERPKQVRERMASLWADYTLQSGVLQNVGIGAGVRHLGDSYGNVPNTLKAPSVTLVDATVHYDWQGLRRQVNADNLFDDEYVASTFSRSAQNYAACGPTRTVTARLRYRW